MKLATPTPRKRSKLQIENIDYVFVNERVERIVKDFKVYFIDNFQHAAIDVNIEMVINKRPSDVLFNTPKLPDCDPRRGNNADEYAYWAGVKLKKHYQVKHEDACQNKDTQEALIICEAFDEECILQGIDDDSLGEGRGKIPRREPWKAVPKT